MPNGMYGRGPQQQGPGGLVSLVRGIRGIADMPARREATAQYVNLMSQTLRRHGTPYSDQLATIFEQNPRGFIMFANQMGGMNAVDQMLAQQAQSQQQQQQRYATELIMQDYYSRPEGERGGLEDLYSRLRMFAGDEQAAEIVEGIQGIRDPGELKAVYDPDPTRGTIGRYMTRAEAVGQPPIPPPETYLETTPEGVIYRTGGYGKQTGEALMPTRTTISRLQQKAENQTNRLYRLKLIGESMRPEFHNIPYRLGITLEEWHEKWTKEKDPTIKKSIADFAVYIRRGYQEMNDTLREMSGVAVNPQEADRLKRAMVDLGEHWWEGDSWSKARGKYLDGLMYIARDKARTMYMLKHPGAISAEIFSLDQAYRLVVDYGDKAWNRIKEANPTLTDEAIRNLVDAEVVQEFGVTYNDVRDPRGW